MVDDPCPQDRSYFEELEETTSIINQSISYTQSLILNEKQNNKIGSISQTNTQNETKTQQKNIIKLYKILDLYQEKPNLLDKDLEAMINPIVSCLQTSISNKSIPVHSKDLFKIMYFFTKVIDFFYLIVRFFSHEASEFESILTYLDLVPLDTEFWETRYILLLWLSLIAIVPFDLKHIDVSSNNSIVVRTMDKIKPFLEFPGKEHEAASLFIAKFITRRDVIHIHLDPFMKWCLIKLESGNPFWVKNVLFCLCAILKCGQRDLLLNHIHSFQSCLVVPSNLIEINSIVRKYWVKLHQRIGLCCLKSRVATWRYSRGNRSLKLGQVVSSGGDFSIDSDDDIYVDPFIEDVLGIVLEGLRDKVFLNPIHLIKDTIVRWSCAKAIGRISERLPLNLAQEIIDSVLDLFSENIFKDDLSTYSNIDAVSDSTWHGACLALAELARRGLLLPNKLSIAVKCVARALKFDQRKGSHSVGSHVRDAACYVTWSFARAYSPEIMQPHVHILATELVTVSVFDREINIRRAASASFQENVGRQGLFPNGIDIIQIADYFSIGNRTHSYLVVSKQIGQFKEYRIDLIDHLLSNIGHWDKSIRILVSQAFSQLAELDPKYMIDFILPKLINKTTSFDSNEKHGALLSIGELCSVIPKLINGELEKCVEPCILKNVVEIIPLFPLKKLESFGSDLLRQGLCRLIVGLSKGDWPLDHESIKLNTTNTSTKTTKSITSLYMNIISTTLENKEEYLQKEGSEALSCYFEWLLKHQRTKELDVFICQLVETIISGRNIKSGMSLSFGYLSETVISKYWKKLMDALILVSEKPVYLMENNPELRRNALISLMNINTELGNQWVQVTLEDYTRTITCFHRNMNDYSVDSRGDVGSWIREACMNGLDKLYQLMLKHHSEYSNIEINTKTIGLFIKQSVEKIDRVRETAGTILLKLVDYEIEFENKIEIQRLISRVPSWIQVSSLYPKMIEILNYPGYRDFLLEGYIVCIGGLGESLVRSSSSALIDCLNKPITTKDQNESITHAEFMETVNRIFTLNLKNDRVSGCILETMNILFESQTFQSNSLELEQQIILLIELVKKEVLRSKDVKKLMNAIKVYILFHDIIRLCGISNYFMENLNEITSILLNLFKSITSYLVHPFPIIRKFTAEEFYLVLTVNSFNDSVTKLEFEDLMLGTEWEKDLDENIKIKVGVLIDAIMK